MSTRAEEFRYFAERSGPKRPKKAVAAAGADKAHNASQRAARSAVYAFEESQGQPSRKSTRKGANRIKNDVQFRMKRKVHEVRPEDRPRPPAR